MVGPLKGGSHKKKYLLVMVDKFTKWIEAKPVKTAEAGPVMDFISGVVPKEIFPRGNNKVIIISLIHDKCLLFML